MKSPFIQIATVREHILSLIGNYIDIVEQFEVGG